MNNRRKFLPMWATAFLVQQYGKLSGWDSKLSTVTSTGLSTNCNNYMDAYIFSSYDKLSVAILHYT